MCTHTQLTTKLAKLILDELSIYIQPVFFLPCCAFYLCPNTCLSFCCSDVRGTPFKQICKKWCQLPLGCFSVGWGLSNLRHSANYEFWSERLGADDGEGVKNDKSWRISAAIRGWRKGRRTQSWSGADEATAMPWKCELSFFERLTSTYFVTNWRERGCFFVLVCCFFLSPANELSAFCTSDTSRQMCILCTLELVDVKWWRL